MKTMPEPPRLWEPARRAEAQTEMGQYISWLNSTKNLKFASYDELWSWSVEDLEGFWTSIWEYFGISSAAPPAALSSREMPGANWFEGARISYPRHALRYDGGDTPAVVSRSQSRAPAELSWHQLREQVARASAGLRRLGVRRGDRVAGYLPNIPEAVVAFLATASIGAIWSSCAPEFGTRSVVDRFAQINPTILLATDGYRYGAKAVDRAAEVAEIRAALPSLTATIAVPFLHPEQDRVPDATSWADLLSDYEQLTFEAVPFDHPLYVLYSSGTTGLPKPIVHGHGGMLIEHLKVLALHHDLGTRDRFCWFTTTGWMMWNYLVSGLLLGTTIVLIDGDPAYPEVGSLWDLVTDTRTTFFGTSAPYVMASHHAGVEPNRDGALSALRAVGITGSPLPPEGFQWLSENLPQGVPMWSASGGTDVCSAFVAGAPLVPVWKGEISCRCLGAAVSSFDPDGEPAVGQVGELVVTEPMPSMPVAFWGDIDGSRYRDAYFSVYPGVWHHGDWITITDRGSCVISGRSDATLNRGGVRLGTAEFYAVVEADAAIADSIVVHLEDDSGGPGELLLFVVPVSGADLSDELTARLSETLRAELSPRHIPDVICAVPSIPRTLSGKKLEIPVKRILTGTPIAEAASAGALGDPGALDAFGEFAAQRTSRR